jgi:hypothetical protein
MRSSPRRIGRTLCSELSIEIDVGGVTHRSVSQTVCVPVMVVPVTVAVPVTATVQLGVLDQIQFLLGQVSIQATERYLGCKQKLRIAVNDRLGIEPAGL